MVSVRQKNVLTADSFQFRSSNLFKWSAWWLFYNGYDWNSIDSYQLTAVGIPLPTKILNPIEIQAGSSTIEAVPALAVRVVIFVWIPFIRFSWLWPHGKYQIWTNNIALLLLTTTNDCTSTSWSSTSHLCHLSIVAPDVVCIPASHISASGRGSNSGRRRRGRLGWRNVSVRLVA